MVSLSDKTRFYFETWVSALMSMLLFPVLIAGVFATILAMSRAVIEPLGGEIEKIGDLVPLLMVVVLSIILVAASPLILAQITGSFQLGYFAGSLARGSAAPIAAGLRVAGKGAKTVVPGRSRDANADAAEHGNLNQARLSHGASPGGETTEDRAGKLAAGSARVQRAQNMRAGRVS